MPKMSGKEKVAIVGLAVGAVAATVLVATRASGSSKPPPDTADGTVTVTTVYEGSSEPVGGATVTIGSYSVQTDPSGVATFTDIPFGDYPFSVSEAGYVTQNDNFSIGGNFALPITLVVD